jgi:hypothetical protein
VQTEKQPKPKNKLDPKPEHGMGKHWANPSQQREKNKIKIEKHGVCDCFLRSKQLNLHKANQSGLKKLY